MSPTSVTDIADGSPATIKIVEKDADGTDDPVTTLSAVVSGGRIKCRWQVKYTTDEDDADSQQELAEKGYTLPEYAFVVECGGATSGKSGCPLFALEPTEADENKFDIMTAQYLYDEHAVQWFEPLADKYRRLIWINPRCLETGTEEYEACKHFTWQDIIDFALINRPSIAYAKYASGDWKFVADGADKYLLVMVGNKPYWADAIGQIPFAVDTMRLYLEKYEGDVTIQGNGASRKELLELPINKLTRAEYGM